jgi:hypothetical protein
MLIIIIIIIDSNIGDGHQCLTAMQPEQALLRKEE